VSQEGAFRRGRGIRFLPSLLKCINESSARSRLIIYV
jgi:hypothetical protein